jgi:hypothetical protein
MIELDYFSFLINQYLEDRIQIRDNTFYEIRKNVSELTIGGRYKAMIRPRSECDNNGNSGRDEHGNHIHFFNNDYKGELDIFNEIFDDKCTTIPAQDKKKILKLFKIIEIKEKIIDVWNIHRPDLQIKLDINNNIIKK